MSAFSSHVNISSLASMVTWASRVIVLTRRNKLAQFLSHRRAAASSEWVRWVSAKNDRAEGSAAVDVDWKKFADFVARDKKILRVVRDVVASSSTTWSLELDYESSICDAKLHDGGSVRAHECPFVRCTQAPHVTSVRTTPACGRDGTGRSQLFRSRSTTADSSYGSNRHA